MHKTGPMRFYLGTHRPNWLGQVTVPLFISHRQLRLVKQLPHAICDWALDSGGFIELSRFGRWTFDGPTYVAAVRRYMSIGRLQWAAIQDWLCEPIVLAKTGLSLDEHLRRTVASYLELRRLAPEMPWAPVLQGWKLEDYHRCADMYEDAGVDLSRRPIVGVGTMCRRQATNDAVEILSSLAGRGYRLHGFGFKLAGLRRVAHMLESADSTAWSFAARLDGIRLPGHTHRVCNNCQDWALLWRARVVADLEGRPVPPIPSDAFVGFEDYGEGDASHAASQHAVKEDVKAWARQLRLETITADLRARGVPHEVMHNLVVLHPADSASKSYQQVITLFAGAWHFALMDTDGRLTLDRPLKNLTAFRAALARALRR